MSAGPKEAQIQQLRAAREEMRETRLKQLMNPTGKPVPYAGKDGTTGRPPGGKNKPKTTTAPPATPPRYKPRKPKGATP